MANFMATVRVGVIEWQKGRAPDEGQVSIMTEEASPARLIISYLRKDFDGAFLFLQADNTEQAKNLLQTIPMLRYMQVEIVELVSEGA